MQLKASLILAKLLLGSAVSLLTIASANVAQAASFTFGDRRYFLSDTFGSWTTAQTQAESAGGHLVTITSQAEQDFLVNAFGGVDLLWIGFTDRLVEGKFQWIDGETATYTNWAEGEANNEMVFGGEDYAVMNWTQPGLWNDLPDDVWKRQLRGIIEVPLAQVPEPSGILATVGLGFLGASYWRKRRA